MPEDSSELEDPVPPRLVEDLRSLYAPLDSAVPSRIDDAIRGRARAAMLRSRRRRTLRWVGAAAGLAAAACVAVVVWVVRPERGAAPIAMQTQSDVPHVTIVDALKLAHQIQNGTGRDVNGDGKIDQADVDAVASLAVRLEQGGVE